MQPKEGEGNLHIEMSLNPEYIYIYSPRNKI